MTKSEVVKSEMFAVFPELTTWDTDEWQFWTYDDGTFSVHQVFIVFSHYVAEKLEAEDTDGMGRVFRYIETKLGGDEEIDEAACTCFLENIMNRVPCKIDPATFVALLGPKSRQFCKDWDEWCQTETEGLQLR